MMKQITSIVLACLLMAQTAWAADVQPAKQPVTATTVATAIKTQTGCTTSGYVWVPSSNTCVAQSGGGGTPGGSSGQIQYNNAGSFGGLALGATLQNASGTLVTYQPADRTVTGTTDTILSTDAGIIVTYNNASGVAVTVPAASATGFTQGFAFTVSNTGAGTVVLTPTTSLINGAATLSVPAYTGCYIRSNGTNYLPDLSSCSSLAAASGSATNFTASSATNSFTTAAGIAETINPGTAATSTSVGSAVTITGGNGGATGGLGGAVTITGGISSSGVNAGGGALLATGGNAVSGTSVGQGGLATFAGGSSTNGYTGGNAIVKGGNGGGPGGSASLIGGAETGGGYTGGNVYVTGGGAFSGQTPGNAILSGGTAGTLIGNVYAASPLVSTGTKFTISGCSATAGVGGAQVGTFTSGTSGTCTVVITLQGATGEPAPNGWSCWSNDHTTPADRLVESGSTTTTVTLTGTTASGDVFDFGCLGD